MLHQVGVSFDLNSHLIKHAASPLQRSEMSLLFLKLIALYSRGHNKPVQVICTWWMKTPVDLIPKQAIHSKNCDLKIFYFGIGKLVVQQ